MAGGLSRRAYFLSITGLVIFALRPETIPATLQDHPLRSALAVIALAIFALFAVGVAFFVGAWFDRRADEVAYESYTAKMRALNVQKRRTPRVPPRQRPGHSDHRSRTGRACVIGASARRRPRVEDILAVHGVRMTPNRTASRGARDSPR